MGTTTDGTGPEEPAREGAPAVDDPDGPGGTVGTGTAAGLPRSVVRASRALLLLVAVGALTTLLVVVQSEELLAAWTAGHPPDSTIAPLDFVPVAVVLYGVFVGSVLLVRTFFLGGHGWARHVLTATVLFVVFATVAALRTDPPTAFVVVSVVGLVVEAACLVLLWHRDTSAFLRAVDHLRHG